MSPTRRLVLVRWPRSSNYSIIVADKFSVAARQEVGRKACTMVRRMMAHPLESKHMLCDTKQPAPSSSLAFCIITDKCDFQCYKNDLLIINAEAKAKNKTSSRAYLKRTENYAAAAAAAAAVVA